MLILLTQFSLYGISLISGLLLGKAIYKPKHTAYKTEPRTDDYPYSCKIFRTDKLNKEYKPDINLELTDEGVEPKQEESNEDEPAYLSDMSDHEIAELIKKGGKL